MNKISLSSFKNKKVFITGHTGFKGSWLSLWLTQLGAKVTGVSIDVPTEPSHFNTCNLPEFLNDVRMDICQEDKVHQLLETIQPDFVFHLAAQALVKESYSNPLKTWMTNTYGTLSLLEGLRKLKKPCIAIFITSDKCYDNVEWVWGYRETDALGGGDPYSGSKGGAELAIRSYVRSFFPKDGQIQIGIGRAGNVIGGGDWAKDRIVPDCMKAWSIGNSVSIRNPYSTRPWQHVLEPLSGYLNLALHLQNDPNLHGEAFNFGPPAEQNHSVGELVEGISNHWSSVKWDKPPINASLEMHEAGLLKLNCDKALHHLKWKAIWDFETTVRETALWYKNYYEDRSSTKISNFSISQIQTYLKSAQQQGQLWASL